MLSIFKENNMPNISPAMVAVNPIRNPVRKKDLIISGGLNVYPAEVEKVINSLPEIYECALIGAPHPDFGEGVTAVITLNDPEISFDERDMKSRLNSQIANYKVPKKIIFNLGKFGRGGTSTGKSLPARRIKNEKRRIKK